MDTSITVISQGNTAKKMKLIREKLSETTMTTTTAITIPTSVTCRGFDEQRHVRCRISVRRDRLPAPTRRRRGDEKKQKVVIRTRSKRKRHDNIDGDEYGNDKNNDKTKRYGRFFGDEVVTHDDAFAQRIYDVESYTNMDLNQCCKTTTQCSINKDGVIKRLLRYGFSSTNNNNNSGNNNNNNNNDNNDLEKPLYKTLEKLRFVKDDGSGSTYENDFYCQLLPTITEEVIEENDEEVIKNNEEEDEYEYEQVADYEPFYWNEVSFPEDFYKNTCINGEIGGGGRGYVMMCSPTHNDQQHVYECVEQMER